MITLLTGLPGNGKTLFALWSVKRYAETENKRLKADSEKTGAALVVRGVYYSGITDLTLPWMQIEPTAWNDCPPGSIIVIDEAQTVFPKKPNGATLPAHYDLLATHRHKGFDIFLITQHPSLVDNFVRKLTGRHYHSVRKFGMQRATVFEWSAASNAPESPASQKAAIPLKWAYPSEVFSYYKSAEVHTVKRSIPGKVILAAGFVLLMIGVFYYVVDSYQKRAQGAQKGDGVSDSSSVSSGPQGRSLGSASPLAGALSGVGRVDPLEDAKRFAFEATPRVEGVAHTAPKYDQMTRPVRVPVPAMCIRKKSACKCFSQQGTSLQVPLNMCYEIAYSGFFQEFNPDGVGDPVKQSSPVDRSSTISRDVALASSSVTVMPHIPEVSRYGGAK